MRCCPLNSLKMWGVLYFLASSIEEDCGLESGQNNLPKVVCYWDYNPGFLWTVCPFLYSVMKIAPPWGTAWGRLSQRGCLCCVCFVGLVLQTNRHLPCTFFLVIYALSTAHKSGGLPPLYRVTWRHINENIKGHTSQADNWQVAGTVALPVNPSRFGMCAQFRPTTGFRRLSHTMLCLCESHWGYFLRNVSFIQNSVLSELILHWNGVINGSCVLREETPNVPIDHKQWRNWEKLK